MNRRSGVGYFCGLVLAAIGIFSARAQETSQPIKAGFSERDITPDLGMEAPGGYGKSYHRSFHDACKVRAAVFDDGRKKVAVVGIDLLFITRHLTKLARNEIQRRCGIPGDHVLIGASHSHSSGPMGMSEPGDFDQAEPWVRELAENKTIISNPGTTSDYCGKSRTPWSRLTTIVWTRKWRLGWGTRIKFPSTGGCA